MGFARWAPRNRGVPAGPLPSVWGSCGFWSGFPSLMILSRKDGHHENRKQHVRFTWPCCVGGGPGRSGTKFGPSGPWLRVKSPGDWSGWGDGPLSSCQSLAGAKSEPCTLRIYHNGAWALGTPELWEVGPGWASCHCCRPRIGKHFPHRGLHCPPLQAVFLINIFRVLSRCQHQINIISFCPYTPPRQELSPHSLFSL